MKSIIALSLVVPSMLMTTACGTPPQAGFSGPGCYDHKGVREPTIRTPGECNAAAWVWRTEPWQGSPAKP